MINRDDALGKQLVRLGDMMGDGFHLEPGGRWIEREYRKTLVAMGMMPKPQRRDVTEINELMAVRTKEVACACGDSLRQTRSGSFVARCDNCGKKYRLLSRGR